MKFYVCIVLALSLSCYQAPAQESTSLSSSISSITAPKQRWSFATAAPIYASPLIEKGIIYIGSTDSNFYALRAESGQLAWKFKSGGEIRSTACSDENNVYFFSGDGCLYSINKTTQHLNWKFRSRGDKKYALYSFADYFQSSPLLQKDTLFFGSGDGYVYAVDARKGTSIWEFKTASVVHSSPVYDNNTVYIGSFDGYMYALHSGSGTLQWKFKSVGHRYFPQGEMQGSPIAFEGMIFCASRDYNFYALDATKGHALWNKQFPRGWAMAKPVVKDSILYIGTSDDKLILALNPYFGTQLWQTNVKFNVFASFAFYKQQLIGATLMGRLYALDAQRGTILWQVDNELYKKNRSKYLKDDESYRDDIGLVIRKDEDVLTMYNELGAIFSTPLVWQDVLFTASTDGSIRCYSLSP